MSDLLPEIADEPRDVAHALDLHARIDAVGAWLDRHKSRLRDWLDAKADEVEALTGGAFNVPVAGVGRVQRTGNPPPKPGEPDLGAKVSVVDRQALVSWWYGEHPDECETVRRVEITDPDRFLDAFDRWGELPDDAARAEILDVAADLYSAAVVHEDVVIPKDVADRLIVTADGKVVDEDGQLVDGVEAKPTRRSLRVVVDSDRKDALLAELETVLGDRLAPSEETS